MVLKELTNFFRPFVSGEGLNGEGSLLEMGGRGVGISNHVVVSKATYKRNKWSLI